MGSQSGSRPAAARGRDGTSGGFTLIELMVAMLIMSIVVLVALESFTTIITSQVRQVSISSSQSQLTLAFVTLDSEVRYSTGIDQPATDPSGTDYVNFEYYTSSNQLQCAELAYSPSAGVLDQRTWAVPASGTLPDPGSWASLASGLTTDGQPFYLVSTLGNDTAAATNMEQLEVSLTSSAGRGPGAESSDSAIVLTAVNTVGSSQPPATPVCPGVTPDDPTSPGAPSASPVATTTTTVPPTTTTTVPATTTTTVPPTTTTIAPSGPPGPPGGPGGPGGPGPGGGPGGP